MRVPPRKRGLAVQDKFARQVLGIDPSNDPSGQVGANLKRRVRSDGGGRKFMPTSWGKIGGEVGKRVGAFQANYRLRLFVLCGITKR